MHPVYILAFATFAIVVAFGIWNITSTRRQQKHGTDITGPGGKNDPLR